MLARCKKKYLQGLINILILTNQKSCLCRKKTQLLLFNNKKLATVQLAKNILFQEHSSAHASYFLKKHVSRVSNGFKISNYYK